VDEAETRIEALRSQGKNPGDGQALIGWFHDFVVARDAASARKRFSVAREERPLTDRFQGIAQVLHASSVDCPAILRRVKSLYDNDRYLRGVASTCGGAALGIHGDYGAMRELYLYDYAVGRQRPWEQLILLALLQRTGAPEDAPVIQGMHMALSGVFSKTLCQVARRHLYLDGVLEEDVDDLLGLPVLAKIEEDLRQQMPVL
jgi:hypothetical protein